MSQYVTRMWRLRLREGGGLLKDAELKVLWCLDSSLRPASMDSGLPSFLPTVVVISIPTSGID